MRRVPVNFRRSGFTRVDLVALIAIGIISFSAIGCPGLGTPREAARKSACANNLKQIGLALLMYEAQFRSFPYGARVQSDSKTLAWTSDWGPSWWLGASAYTEGTPARNFDYNIPECSLTLDKTGNGALLDGYTPGYMFCPTSPLPASVMLPSGLTLAAPTYAAISGTVPDLAGIPINPNWKADWLPGVADVNNPPQGASPRCTQQANPEGTVGGSGIFPPNETVTISQIKDGSSNTLLVGEQSDYGTDAKANNAKVDIRSCSGYGAWLGLGNTGQQNFAAISPDLPGTVTAYNCTTVAFPINCKVIQDIPGKQLQITIPGVVGISTQQQMPKTPGGVGANNGIQSAHDGGAFVVFADGRASFLTDNMDFRVLLYLCNRDDQRGFTPP